MHLAAALRAVAVDVVLDDDALTGMGGGEATAGEVVGGDGGRSGAGGQGDGIGVLLGELPGVELHIGGRREDEIDGFHSTEHGGVYVDDVVLERGGREVEGGRSLGGLAVQAQLEGSGALGAQHERCCSRR